VVSFDSATLFRVEAGRAERLSSYESSRAAFMRQEGGFAIEDDPIFADWFRERRTAPELIPDTREDPRWAGLATGNTGFIEHIRCYLGAPLLIDGQIVGALCLGAMQSHAFDPVTVAAVAEFAERLSRALRNARIYEVERAANARMHAVLRLQDDFVATVSHELRTPLTSILGFSENLLAYWSRMDESRRRASVEKIQRAGTRLDRLVRDLLHLSRIEASALRPNLSAQPLAPLVRQAVEDLTITFPGQRVGIDPRIDAATVLADGDRLRQVIGNLLDNAAKYSPEGTPLAVGWRAEGGHGVLSIHDQGPGVPAESVPLLFRRFGKLDSAIRAGHVGTGLGLYICKQLVEAMGGRIWYEPGHYPPPRSGAVFCVELPLVGAAASAD
jgi:signal transduction histidine kinase